MARTRRAGSEVRALLLDAAQALFAERGFAGTTTRAIADRAGVSETLLFRHFSDKQTLFETAVIEPFNEYVAQYTGAWAARHLEGEPYEILGDLVGHLFDLVTDNKRLFLALRSAHVAVGAQEALQRLEEMAGALAELRGYTYDTPIAARAVVSMVVSMALLEDDLFPPGAAPDRERMVTAMTDILHGGLARQ